MTFACQAPEHEGDRLVVHPLDRVKVSLDFMSADNQTRLYRVHQADLCKTCAERAVGRMRPRPFSAQGALFG